MTASIRFTTSTPAIILRRLRTWPAIGRLAVSGIASASLVAHSNPVDRIASAQSIGAILLFTLLFYALLAPLWTWAMAQAVNQSRARLLAEAALFTLCGLALTYALPVPLAPGMLVDVSVQPLGMGEAGVRAEAQNLQIRLEVDGEPIPPGLIEHDASWQVKEGYLTTERSSAAVHWRGRSEYGARVLLASNAPSTKVRVNANGRVEDIALDSGSTSDPVQVLLHSQRDIISFFAPDRAPVQRLVQLFDAMLIGAALWLCFVALSYSRREPSVVGSRLAETLWFGLPSLAVSIYLLLVFGPAIMTTDSVDQWLQATNGYYNDWHPAYHSMAIHLLRQVWDSPTFIALIQAAILALSTGWLIASVRAATRASRSAAWLGAWACALMPMIAFTSITLWKDVPYTATVVAITAAGMEIFISKRLRLSQPLVLFAAFCVIVTCMVLRHNGAPVAVITVATLALLVKEQRKTLAILGVSAIVAFALLKGPVSNLAGINKSNVSYMPYAHHIAAHLGYGQRPQDPADVALLQEIGGPLDQWPYQCSVVNSTIFRPGFNGAVAGQHKADLLRIWLELARRNPGVEVQHFACVGGLVWRMTNNAPGDPLYHYTLGVRSNGTEFIWIEPNSQELRGSTMFPDQAQRISRWVTGLDYDLLWRPAVYLYLFLFATAIAIRRMGDWRIAIVALPLLAHSSILLLANVAQDVRYQLPVFVIALATAPCLLRAAGYHQAATGGGEASCASTPRVAPF